MIWYRWRFWRFAWAVDPGDGGEYTDAAGTWYQLAGHLYVRLGTAPR